MIPHTSKSSFVLLIALTMFLTACGGGFVDTGSSGFVDSASGSTFERETVSSIPTLQNSDPVVLNESHEDYIQPPVSHSERAEPLPYEESFAGRSAVELRIWNDRGFERLFLPEGAIVPINSLGVTLEVMMIATSANGDAVVFTLDGEQLPPLRAREEVNVGRTYILVRHVYVR